MLIRRHFGSQATSSIENPPAHSLVQEFAGRIVQRRDRLSMRIRIVIN